MASLHVANAGLKMMMETAFQTQKRVRFPNKWSLIDQIYRVADKKVPFRFLSITFNTLKLETKFEFFEFFEFFEIWMKQHYSCTIKNLIKEIFIIKKMSDARNFLFRWKNIFILLNKYLTVLKFSDYKASIQRKVLSGNWKPN